MSSQTMYKPTGTDAWLLTLCLCLLAPTALAAKSDKTVEAKSSTTEARASSAREPMTISADQLISQTRSGQSEYRGSVQLTRGKLELKGDTLLIQHPGDKLQTATITGKPATLRDYLPKKQQWLKGEARSITFDQSRDTITLNDNASLTLDNGNTIQAQRITLYNKDETFEASGSKDKKGRVQMIIRTED